MAFIDLLKESIGLTDINSNAFDTELLIILNSSVVRIVLLGLTAFEDFVFDETTEFPTMPTFPIEHLAKAYLIYRTRSIFDPTASATIKTSRDIYLGQLEQSIEILCSEFYNPIIEEVLE